MSQMMNEELKETLRNCKTTEELFHAARENGFELTDEELSSVSGGSWDDEYCNPHVCTVVCDSPNGSTQSGKLKLM